MSLELEAMMPAREVRMRTGVEGSKRCCWRGILAEVLFS